MPEAGEELLQQDLKGLRRFLSGEKSERQFRKQAPLNGPRSFPFRKPKCERFRSSPSRNSPPSDKFDASLNRAPDSSRPLAYRAFAQRRIYRAPPRAESLLSHRPPPRTTAGPRRQTRSR